jgi:hypothetical protein
MMIELTHHTKRDSSYDKLIIHEIGYQKDNYFVLHNDKGPARFKQIENSGEVWSNQYYDHGIQVSEKVFKRMTRKKKLDEIST